MRDVSSGFTEISTVVRASGDGHEGLGEDITWDQIDQIERVADLFERPRASSAMLKVPGPGLAWTVRG